MKNYLFSIFYSVIALLIGTLLISVLYYFNITTDKINNLLLYFISILCMFIGSFKFSSQSKFKGILNGLIYFVPFLILSIIFIIVFKTKFSFGIIIYYIIILVFTILSAIISKNIKNDND